MADNKELEKKETIAETAIKGADSVKKGKYIPGTYRSDKFMRVIKALTYENQKDANGVVQKTYGTWAKESNMIVFQKNQERRLTAEDLELPAIQRLIDSKTIFRVGD